MRADYFQGLHSLFLNANFKIEKTKLKIENQNLKFQIQN